MSQIPFLDELKRELLEHASQPTEKTLPVRRRGTRLSGVWVAAAVFAATLVVGGLTWILGGLGSPSPDSAEEHPVLFGEPEIVTIEELDAAVRPAVDALEAAPGFQATETRFFEGLLGEVVWVDARPNGDWIYIRSGDQSVLFDQSEGIQRNAFAYVDGSLYVAGISPDGTDDPWRIVEESAVPEGMPVPIGSLFPTGGSWPEGFYPPGALGLRNTREATRRSMSDGGTLWTVNSDSTAGTVIARWEIHPDGHLSGYSFEADNPVAGAELPTSGQVNFTPLVNPNQISPPDIGSPLQPTHYDIPDDLALLP